MPSQHSRASRGTFVRRRWLGISAGLVVGLVAHSTCFAQTTFQWVGGTSTAWNTGANWAGGTAPANSLTTLQIAQFNSNPTNQPSALSSTMNIYGVVIGAGATSALTITSGLGLGAGGVTKADGSGQVTLQSVRISGTQTWTNNSATLLQNSNLMNNADATASQLTLSGTGAGGFNLTTLSDGSGKGPLSVVVNTSSGTATLTGNSSFTGGVTLTAGIISLNNDGALGTGVFTINGGALNVNVARGTTNNNAQNWNGDFTFLGTSTLNLGTGAVTLGGSRIVTVNASSLTVGGVISGSGYGLIKDGAGTLRLAAANTFSGATTVTGGTLALLDPLALQNSQLDTSGAGVISGTGVTTATFGGLSGSKNLSAVVTTGYAGWNALTLNPQSGTASYSGVIANGTSSGMSLTKTGNGSQVLTGSNTYSGAATISGGRLVIGPGGSINGSSGVTLNGSTAELRYNSATAFTKPLTLTQGTLSGTGTINTPVSIGANATLSPGNSPGTQTYQSGTFASGGTYTWEINNWASGTAGTNFDQAIFTNGLAITSSTASPFTINVTSLQADNTAGAVPGFNSGLTGLSFAIATGTMTGYSPSVFTLGTSGFVAANTVSGSANGGFWLSTNSGSNQLILNYAPSARYTLSATPAATAIRTGSSTVITGSITNSTADRTGADTMTFSGLAVGTGALSTTSGTLASGNGASGTVTYTGTAAGQFTFTPMVASATNVNLGSAALAGTVTSGTVNVYSPAVATIASSTISLGSVRLSGTFGTQNLSVTNSGAASSGYQEGLSGQYSSTSGQATGSGSFTNLFTGSASSGISVGLGGSTNTATAGVKSGTVALAFTSTGTTSLGATGLSPLALASQNVVVSGTVWNTAAANTLTGSTNLGSVIVGASFNSFSQALSITNTAPGGGFSEKLDASFGTLSGAVTNSGSISLLSAGATNSTAMVVGLATGSVGYQLGSAEVLFTSDGADTSGLAPLSLTPQTVTFAGTVLDHALPGFSAAGITNPYTQTVLDINFGTIDQTAGVQSFTYQLTNLASQLYGAGLTASLDFTGVTPDGNGFASGLSTFNNLTAGGTSSQFTFSFTPGGQGSFNKSFTLSFWDNRNTAGATQRRDLTINAQVIVVPEPDTIMIAGVGLAITGWSLWKRRRVAP